ncbi:AAEL013474-PA [Aedes aegypti]|uniref:AAEL013474-PA n=1 Tax=Aedes aegypti TaxID=7159 RepID=Q16J17_AEDAE|nr:AAEL013474-PA [Aedes aegypti]
MPTLLATLTVHHLYYGGNRSTAIKLHHFPGVLSGSGQARSSHTTMATRVYHQYMPNGECRKRTVIEDDRVRAQQSFNGYMQLNKKLDHSQTML